MELLTTKLNPSQFQNTLGAQKVFIFSKATSLENLLLGIFLIWFVAFIALAIYTSDLQLLFWSFVVFPIILYLSLSPRFRYISLHEDGFIIKHRWRHEKAEYG